MPPMSLFDQAVGSDPETLEGAVERVVYHDTQTRYTVLRVQVPGMLELATAVGRSGGVEDGAQLHLEGSWGDHPTHGRQFQFTRMEVAIPTSLDGIKRRLARYPGIRDVMAERILRRFGLDSLDILERTPERMREVEGIGPRTLARILEHHQSQHGPVARLEARLLEFDLPPHLAGPVHDRYGEEAVDILTHRPYRLARDVRGIGFATADRIARAHGVSLESEERVEAGVVHVLERAESDGHCALPVGALLEGSHRLLEVDADRIGQALERLVQDGDVGIESTGDREELVFPHRFIVAEQRVAHALADLAGTPVQPWPVEALPDHLSAGQADAVRAVAAHRVVVLTGGPGTGKSTVVRNVLELARANATPRLLCAPTGRAAKRLEQTTGEPASTVHRLLEIQPDSGTFGFETGNELPPGLVVVDEASMLDLQLSEALFTALSTDHRLLIVGDADQLPSVGPGNVLRDVIDAADGQGSGVPVVRLTEVFRQAEGSSIVRNAHRILAGEKLAADPPGSDGDFFVISPRSPDHAHDLVLRTVTERIPEAYGLDSRTDIQILAPMHRGRVGTEAFNLALQAHHTAGQPEVEFHGGRGRRYRIGDRVMQTRNDYNRNVFNGDVGVVSHVDLESRRVTVDMDGTLVFYEPKDLGTLQLAYAVSIHKSQGSEFPAVVVSLMPEHHVMLRRNLLYTAITRARRLCVVVADPRALERAIRRSDAARRHTGLRARLQSALGVAPHWDPL